jgi:hypothetical protein
MNKRKESKEKKVKRNKRIVIGLLVMMIVGLTFASVKPKSSSEKAVPESDLPLLPGGYDYAPIPKDFDTCKVKETSTILDEMGKAITETYNMYDIHEVTCNKYGKFNGEISATQVNCSWMCTVYMEEHVAEMGLSKIVDKKEVDLMPMREVAAV